MQVERSPSLLVRRNAAFSPSPGCFSIEDLRGLYAVQSSDFRSVSLPRRLPGPRYNGAPAHNPSSGEDSEEDEDCTPEMFRKAKTQIPRQKDRRSMFSQGSDSEESEDDDSDAEDCFSAELLKRTATQRPTRSAPAEKESSGDASPNSTNPKFIDGGDWAGDESCDPGLFTEMQTQRHMHRGARSETMPVSLSVLSGANGSLHHLKASSSEASMPLCTGAHQAVADPQRLTQSTLVLEEDDVPSLPVAGLGLAQSASCGNMNPSCAASTATSTWAELVNDLRMREDSKGVLLPSKGGDKRSSTGRVRLARPQAVGPQHLAKAGAKQPAPASACFEARSGVEIFFFERPRQSTLAGVKSAKPLPTSASLPGAGKSKDHKPPLSPSFPSSLSATGSSTPERSPKPPLSKLSKSTRALVKCQSEIEKRPPAQGPQPKASTRALVRAHSESERGSIKPKSILVLRQNRLERTSSLGRRVTFNEEVEKFTYSSKK